MDYSDISTLRLHRQLVTNPIQKTVKEAVSVLGAMQAQDYYMAKWAIGMRLSKSTDNQIVEAIDKGEIIRTHLLRPTWHFVSSDDIYWMLELSAPNIRRILKTSDKGLELTEAIYSKSQVILENKLSGNKHLTRVELTNAFIQAGIAVDNNRASHLFMRAEVDGLICSGSIKDTKQTYALLHERTVKIKSLPREEALARLALRYFSSHGPATVHDFMWWSGLSISESRIALESIKSSLFQETIEGYTYWFSDITVTPNSNSNIYLLPAFDEFLISYRNRLAAISKEHQPKAFSTNGIFYPIIVLNGRVIGIWKRALKKDTAHINIELFNVSDKETIPLLEQAAITYGNFLSKKIELIIK